MTNNPLCTSIHQALGLATFQRRSWQIKKLERLSGSTKKCHHSISKNLIWCILVDFELLCIYWMQKQTNQNKFILSIHCIWIQITFLIVFSQFYLQQRFSRLPTLKTTCWPRYGTLMLLPIVKRDTFYLNQFLFSTTVVIVLWTWNVSSSGS